MKRLPGMLALLLLSLIATSLAGQEERSQTLPRGVLAVGFGGEFAHFDSRLGGMNTGGLGEGFAVSFAPTDFPVLDTLRTRLDAFFAATAQAGESFPIGDADLLPGRLSLGLAAERRVIPLTLELGVARRLTVWGRVPVERRRTEVTGLRLRDGAVGRNLRADTLARLLEGTPALAGIARLPYLPLAGSRSAAEIQRRYARASRDTTRLPFPMAPLTGSQVDSLLTRAGSTLPFTSAGGDYLLGDVEAGAVFQLLNTVDGTLPESGYRLTLGAGIRIPTGQDVAPAGLTDVVSLQRHAGASVSAAGELLRGRLAVSANARYAHLFGADVGRALLLVDSLGLPRIGETRSVRRERGGFIHLSLVPRYRLTPEMELRARYAFARLGATRYTGDGSGAVPAFAGLESTEGGSAQRIGIGAEYSTLDAYLEGRAGLPLEVSLLWETTVAGSGGAEALSGITLGVRAFIPLWGER